MHASPDVASLVFSLVEVEEKKEFSRSLIKS